MSKTISFVAPDCVVKDIIDKKPKGANQSQWITELIIKGHLFRENQYKNSENKNGDTGI